jgi:hypothetical protein
VSNSGELSSFLTSAAANIHDPRCFITYCSAIDRLARSLKADVMHAHFATELASHLAGIETPDFAWNAVAHKKNTTLTILAKLVPFNGLLALLIFDDHPNHLFGIVALFVKSLELPANQISRQYCWKAIQSDKTILARVALKLVKSEVFPVMRLLMKFVKVVTFDPTEVGMTITQSLASVLREEVNSRCFLRLSTAFVRADGFIKWLKENQSIAGPWTEQAFHLATQHVYFRETIAYILFWGILGANGIQMPRVTQFARLSLTARTNQDLVLENIRILHRTSSYYLKALPWNPEWGSPKSELKSGLLEWPMNACLK